MKNPKIMVVDDDKEMLKSVSILLKSNIFQVLTASSGEEAIKMALIEKPDVFVIDYLMPGLNGLEVCKTIRENGKFIDCGVILITGQTNLPDDEILGLDAGADDYLIKPFKHRELIARINSVLRVRRLLKENRYSDFKLKHAFDSSINPVFVLDFEGNIELVNKSGLDTFIIDNKPETLPKFSELLVTRYRSKFDRIYLDLMTGVKVPSHSFEFLNVDSKQKKFTISFSGIQKSLITSGALLVLNEIVDAEANDNAGELIAGYERESDFFNKMSIQNTNQTASIYNSSYLNEKYPQIFERFKDKLTKILDLAIEARVFKINPNISKELFDFASELGFMRATPKDVIMIYKAAFPLIKNLNNAKKINLAKDESKIILIELIGYLATYYRNISN